MKKKTKKRWLIWGSLAVVIILIIFAVNKGGKNKGIRVTVEEVESRTLTETVSANGKIEPAVDVMISPYISGEVVELYVREGQEVEKGDKLAKIDPEIYISSYERAEANVSSQKANLANARARLAQSHAQFENAKLSYNRNKKLWEQEVISDSDFDAAKASYEVAKADVEAAKQSVNGAEFGVLSAEASLKEANENLTKTLITAPIGGTISRLGVEVGERVTGASQFSAGTEIMRIANLNAMEANVEVNENDIVRVAINDTCEIEVDAYLNKKFIGEVIEIATSANTAGVSVDQVTNFDVKIRIFRDSYTDLIPEDNPAFSPLRPGMSATVEIQTETSYNQLTVPIQAVTTRADTTEKKAETKDNEDLVDEDDEVLEVVFLYEDGKAKMQLVKTSIQDNKHIIVTEGLEAGQEIITGPYRAVSKRLKDGDEVKVVDKEDLFSDEED